MHENTMRLMALFRDSYATAPGKVLDVGSRKARHYHQCFRPMFSHCKYTGLDIRPGRNVDLIVNPDGYWPAKMHGAFDYVISGNCLEHVPRLGRIAKEMCKALKIGGYMCVSAPCFGRVHCAVDCWRILPDGMRHLFSRLECIECRIDHRDTIGIFRRS